jgi:exodeoxyribonuclease-3
MFTWWAPWRNLRQRNIGWRLDYVLASTPVFDRVTSCIIKREFGTSDHAPVTAVFDLPLERAAVPEEPAAPAPGQMPLF